jgi:dynein heavy chain
LSSAAVCKTRHAAGSLQKLIICMFHLAVQMFVTAHQSVEAMSRSMWQSLKRHNYVTPTNYLETVRNYKALLAEKRTELLAKSNKLKGGLTKLDETRVQVGLRTVL